jgi:hypothetical protein
MAMFNCILHGLLGNSIEMRCRYAIYDCNGLLAPKEVKTSSSRMALMACGKSSHPAAQSVHHGLVARRE